MQLLRRCWGSLVCGLGRGARRALRAWRDHRLAREQKRRSDDGRPQADTDSSTEAEAVKQETQQDWADKYRGKDDPPEFRHSRRPLVGEPAADPPADLSTA